MEVRFSVDPVDSSLTGMVFHIQRFSTEDGPGIRTTVFLKGCALQCMWCQNPESWSPNPQLVWYEDKCIAARHCISACPNHALTLTPQGLQINRSKCDACGACIPVCPTKALDILGSKYTVAEVVAKVLRDGRETLQLTQGKMHKNPLLH